MNNTNPTHTSSMIANIVLWIFFGGIAGWIASLIVGDDQSFGVVGNIAVGVIGAFIGGWIADRVGVDPTPGVERPSTVLSFVWAVAGSIILLLVLNLVL